jgi:MYXO-CTERM domain-containing protein
LLLQSFTPGDCVLTGLCGVPESAGGPPSGILFLAIGIVLIGGLGLYRSRRRA